MTSVAPRLEAHGLSKRFPGVLAVDQADLVVAPGEIHALAGENGSGKSTLCMMLSGVHAPDGGTIAIDGKPVAPASPRHAQLLGVSMMYQESNLAPELTIAQNVALGHESFFVRGNQRNQAVQAILERLGFDLDPRARASSLSGAQMQMVEIAKALFQDARIIIMDEPTAALGAAEAERLHAVIRDLASSGVGVIYISHALEESLQLADRVTVMRDGRVVGCRPSGELTRAALIEMMVGRHVGIVDGPQSEVRSGEELLRAEGLNWRGRVHGADLVLNRGEIVGLAGLVGAGRSELAGLLSGIAAADSGRLLVKGKPVRFGSPRHAMRAGVATLTENRKEDGLFLDLSVKVNLTIRILQRLAGRLGWIRRSAERAKADELVWHLNVVTKSIDVPARTLSGGNQQKLLLARLLASEPDILILDEPTKGVDVGAIEEIHKIVRGLADQGRAILVISSYLPELLALSDRIYVMRSGRIVTEVAADQARAADIISEAFH